MTPLYLLLAVVAVIALYFFLAGKRSGAKHTTPVRRAGRSTDPEEDAAGAGDEDAVKASAPRPRADAKRKPVHPKHVVNEGSGARKGNASTRKIPPSPPPVVMNADTLAFEYLDHTVLYYEPYHGNQIEYYGADGRSYLWYPGNRGVVVSEWRIEGEDYCVRSPSNAYNPATQEWGGKWERRPVHRLLETKVDAAPGDVFGLSTGRVPYPLHAQPGFESVMDAEHPPAVVQMPPPLRPVRPPPKAIDSDVPCPCGSNKPFASCHGSEIA
jgi:hypothetical protein